MMVVINKMVSSLTRIERAITISKRATITIMGIVAVTIEAAIIKMVAAIEVEAAKEAVEEVTKVEVVMITIIDLTGMMIRVKAQIKIPKAMQLFNHKTKL